MRLHVHEYGDPTGAPLLCLHGVTGHGERFRRLGEGRLAARRVLAPDLRGHGRSEATPPWSTAAHVADAVELCDERGLPEVDLIGFSFGGRVAAALAAAHPDRVRRLVLLDPALRLPASVCLEQAEAEREERSFADADEAIADRLAAGTLFHTPREMLEEEMRQNLVRGADGRLRERHAAVAAISAWSEMAEDPPPVADVPTLVVRGERSWVPVAVDRYPRAEHLVLPGGHSLLWDAFDATAGAVERFLEG